MLMPEQAALYARLQSSEGPQQLKLQCQPYATQLQTDAFSELFRTQGRTVRW